MLKCGDAYVVQLKCPMMKVRKVDDTAMRGERNREGGRKMSMWEWKTTRHLWSRKVKGNRMKEWDELHPQG